VNYILVVTDEHFQAIWQGLGEIPGRLAFPAMEALKRQVETQEAWAATGDGWVKKVAEVSPLSPLAQPVEETSPSRSD
jgi:hypothetical protein